MLYLLRSENANRTWLATSGSSIVFLSSSWALCGQRSLNLCLLFWPLSLSTLHDGWILDWVARMISKLLGQRIIGFILGYDRDLKEKLGLGLLAVLGFQCSPRTHSPSPPTIAYSTKGNCCTTILIPNYALWAPLLYACWSPHVKISNARWLN